MILVKPSFEILTDLSIENLKLIELAGRTCYKSENKITDDSAVEFVRKIIKRGHLSVIEHASASVKFIIDRSISHELVRHRLCAFSQECLTGDTEVRKGLTIKQLFDRGEKSPYGKTHNKTIHLRSMKTNGDIVPNKISQIWKKGKGHVYKVTTNMGYTITTTMNHQFAITENNYIELSNLSIGDTILVNGRPCLIKISDNELKNLYLNQKMSPTEIANHLECPYRSVVRKLKHMNIFINHLNDKNKEKYNKNHTIESHNKMKKSILKSYQNGRMVWNKNIRENDHPSVKKQADSLRAHHHNNLPEHLSSTWKGGTSTHIGHRRKSNITQCELCNSNTKLEVHHKNRNPKDNSVTNLIKVCISCHTLLHHGWHIGKKAIKDTIIDIQYIGQKDIYDIEMKKPFNNFVANGFIVHNSTRYCNYKGGVTFVIPPWVNIKPGEDYQTICRFGGGTNTWYKSLREAENSYLKLLNQGWSPQQARSVLPNSLKTEIVTTANFREWKHIFDLRCSEAAHPQMREIMIPLQEEFRKRIPVIFEDKRCNIST